LLNVGKTHYSLDFYRSALNNQNQVLVTVNEVHYNNYVSRIISAPT